MDIMSHVLRVRVQSSVSAVDVRMYVKYTMHVHVCESSYCTSSTCVCDGTVHMQTRSIQNWYKVTVSTYSNNKLPVGELPRL